MNAAQEQLLQTIDEAFEGPAWHGPVLMPTLRTLSLDQLRFRSPYEGFSAWQIVLHCAYWKHIVRGRLVASGRIGRFPRSPRDWPKLPESETAEAWQKDLDLLIEEHRLFREVVAALTARRLRSEIGATHRPVWREALSIAAHDVYHTAQIRNIGIPGLK